MKKTRMIVRRTICILLCVLMLPLIKVSAAGYTDAYNTLVALAKTGGSHNDGEYKYYILWDDTTMKGKEYSIQHYTPLDGQSSDYVVVLSDTIDQKTDSHIVMFFSPDEPDFVGMIFSMEGGYAEAEITSRYSLNDDLKLSYREGKVSEKIIKQQFKNCIKVIFEYIDAKLRAKNSKLSIQDIFKNINPKSLHTLNKNWVEKAETCTVDGSMGYQCAVCGTKLYEPIKAHHNWEITRVDTEATAEHGFGEYTCSRCGEKKEEEICISRQFTDMPAYDNWAHPGIDWAVYNAITNGTSATTFGPGQGCTRGQVVTFLWRAAGSPEPENLETPFQDVKSGAFYEKAVAWAVENKITAGTSETTFSPDTVCSRGQIVTFLWRFKGAPLVDTEGTQFVDLKSGAFYQQAVSWAAMTNVTAGTDATHFSPNNTCTRAQVVTFLFRAQKDAALPVE